LVEELKKVTPALVDVGLDQIKPAMKVFIKKELLEQAEKISAEV
jgi:hypothetical protein